jgi:hypothetical protein
MSCKSTTSNERCTSPRIKGLTLCGRHVKSKSTRLWHIVNNLDPKVTLISKAWRGYAVRIRLRRAGPGVLKRSICHNDEELVTMDSKNKYDPFDFFSFQEGDKVWWFDVCSIIACLNSSMTPLNPYTRQPLSLDTRHRLRTVYNHRIFNRLRTSHSPQKYLLEEVVDRNWLKICQVLQENGFEYADPRMFSRLSKSDLLIILGFLVVDMRILAEEHPKSSKRHRYYAILKRERDVSFATSHRTVQLQVSNLVMHIMNDMVEVYPFCFLVMSALYRL